MSDGPQGLTDAGAGARAGSGGEIAILLECFNTKKGAGEARKGLDAGLKAKGGTLLDSVVLEVDAKRRAAVHDPRRVLLGTLTAALTWGLFGLIAGGWSGLAVWAVLGAICGGLWAYYTEHQLSKNELTRIGARLPANSSALATFAETRDAAALLAVAASHAPVTASVAAIGADLGAKVYVGGSSPIESSSSTGKGGLPLDQAALTSMVVFRYPDADTAKLIADDSASGKGSRPPLDIELIFRSDPDGRRHVTSPTYGAAANSLQSLISWAAFGLVYGAIVGVVSGGGVLGMLQNALVVGVLWGLFGIVAGALFGLWAGRGVSARRLRSVGALLAPNSSILLAWTDRAVDQATLDRYLRPGAQRLVLRFNPVPGGALLEAA
ncbi:hypothetical protein [Microbacterium pumilum]|uniref:DUF1269 domain-containing protein n=1 Tax=Microbacterium pumilum TaxID=344165 RepID=A0ABN2S2X9_9MICO